MEETNTEQAATTSQGSFQHSLNSETDTGRPLRPRMMIGISVFEGYFPPFHSANCYSHQVTSQVGHCPHFPPPHSTNVEAPLPSLFDQTNYSGQKQAEIVYSEQQQGQLAAAEGQQAPVNNMIYQHPICALTTNSVIYPANTSSETGQF